MVCVWYGSLQIYSTWSASLSFSDVYNVFPSHFESFQSLFTQSFWHFLALLSFCDFIMYMLYTWWYPHKVLRLLIFLHSFFPPPVLHLDNLKRCIFKFADFFLLLAHSCCWVCLEHFCFLVTVFFNSRVSIWFFFIIEISLLVFSTCWDIVPLFFLSLFSYLSIFKISDLMSWFSKSNVLLP